MTKSSVKEKLFPVLHQESQDGKWETIAERHASEYQLKQLNANCDDTHRWIRK